MKIVVCRIILQTFVLQYGIEIMIADAGAHLTAQGLSWLHSRDWFGNERKYHCVQN